MEEKSRTLQAKWDRKWESAEVKDFRFPRVECGVLVAGLIDDRVAAFCKATSACIGRALLDGRWDDLTHSGRSRALRNCPNTVSQWG